MASRNKDLSDKATLYTQQSAESFPVDVLLDSGAFSSWKLGVNIDRQTYADYLNLNKGCYNYAINLDQIPGRFGVKPSRLEVDEAAENSWENLKWLESQGLDILPVFHQGEDPKWLERLIQEGYDYVCISPDNGKSTGQKREWLDMVFTMLTVDGYPIIKTHGLAVTSVDLMRRYPWYSVDSATWIVVGAYGGTFVPKITPLGPDYTVSPYVVYLTDKSTSNLESGMHINNFAPSVKQDIMRFFADENIPYKDLIDDCVVRSRICLRVLKNITSTLSNQRFIHPVHDFFTDLKRISKGRSPIAIPEVTVYYALSCAAIYSDALTVEGIDKRLFSYNILRNKENDFLDFYAKTGVFPKGQCWKRWVDANQIIQEQVDLSFSGLT